MHAHTRYSRSRRQAFSLLEILIVVSIIFILVGLVMAVTGPVKRVIRDTKTKAQIKQLAMVMEAYYQDWGYYPQQSSAEPISAEFFFSLKSSDRGIPFYRQEDFSFDQSDSYDDPDDSPDKGPIYYRPTNAFSQPFYYESPGEVHPDGFDIWCAGYDGGFGPGTTSTPADAQATNARTDDSSDDIANWKRLH